MRINVALACLIQCADRCRRQVADDAIFFNILDIAGINAWIIFRKTQASCISRQKFLRQLTHRSNVVSKQSNSGANLIVFNNESTWQNSQLSSEVSRQTQQNHHNVWRLHSANDRFVASAWRTSASSARHSVSVTDPRWCSASIDAGGCSRYTLLYRRTSITKRVFALISQKTVQN